MSHPRLDTVTGDSAQTFWAEPSRAPSLALRSEIGRRYRRLPSQAESVPRPLRFQPSRTRRSPPHSSKHLSTRLRAELSHASSGFWSSAEAWPGIRRVGVARTMNRRRGGALPSCDEPGPARSAGTPPPAAGRVCVPTRPRPIPSPPFPGPALPEPPFLFNTSTRPSPSCHLSRARAFLHPRHTPLHRVCAGLSSPAEAHGR